MLDETTMASRNINIIDNGHNPPSGSQSRFSELNTTRHAAQSFQRPAQFLAETPRLPTLRELEARKSAITASLKYQYAPKTEKQATPLYVEVQGLPKLKNLPNQKLEFDREKLEKLKSNILLK